MVTKSNGTQEMSDYRSRLFGYQVSDSRTEVSDVWDSPMHLYIFSPYTVGRKLDFFLSYAQHSRDFFHPRRTCWCFSKLGLLT